MTDGNGAESRRDELPPEHKTDGRETVGSVVDVDNSALPGDVKRGIEANEVPDPIWYVGRTGPSAQDVLDATGAALEQLRQLVHEPNGNGNGQAIGRRHRQHH